MKPFCMLLYNLMQVVQGYVAQSQSCEPTEISSELMFRDVEDQLIAWETFGRRLRRGQETRCKRRREIVALGGRKVQRLACLNYSLERGWQLTARGLFINSTLHRSRLSESSVFVASHHEVGSSGRRLRGCDSGGSDGPGLPQSVVHCSAPQSSFRMANWS